MTPGSVGAPPQPTTPSAHTVSTDDKARTIPVSSPDAASRHLMFFSLHDQTEEVSEAALDEKHTLQSISVDGETAIEDDQRIFLLCRAEYTSEPECSIAAGKALDQTGCPMYVQRLVCQARGTSDWRIGTARRKV